MPELNESHDPTLTSWIDSANEAEADFPVQNLPLGVYTDPKTGVGKVGIAIGDEILDVTAARAKGVIGGAADDAAGALCRRYAQRIDGVGRAALVGAACDCV